MKVVWLTAAQADFDKQIDYIFERNPSAGLEQGEIVVHSIDGLATHPNKGRDGRRKGTRELVIDGTPFVAVYRVRPRLGRVEILFLLHHAERWPKRRSKGIGPQDAK